MEYDNHSNVQAATVIAPVTIATNTTTVGAIVDSQGFESLEYLIQSGVITDGSYTTVLEEGDDPALADAAPVPAANILGALPAFADTDDGVSKRVGSIGKKRYQRLSIVSAGVTAGGLFSAVAVQGNPKSGPVADQS